MIHRKPLVATVLFVLATSATAFAQAPTEAPPPDRNPFLYLFHNLVLDAKRLPSIETAVTLGIGGGLALAVHPVDDTVTERATAGGPRGFYRVGSDIGDGWAQVGFAVGTYATGVVTGKRSVTHFGGDLVRAQTINFVLAQGIKFAARRHRPGNPDGNLVLAAVRSHVERIRHGRRGVASLRLEGGPAGVGGGRLGWRGPRATRASTS